MSYDLKVWSVHPADDACLPKPGEWQPTASGWFLGQGRGALEIWKSDKVWPEDIPDAIGTALPGIAFLTRLTASGELTKALLSRAGRAGKALASACHGVVLDPQEGSLLLPPSVRRFLPVQHRQELRFAITQLSWWTLDGAAFRPEGIARFVALLERLLPEALPRRYGLWEPPQYAYAETGRNHLIQFLGEHACSSATWYPTRPVANVCLATPGKVGSTARGFRAHHLAIAIETLALDQPGWETQLRLVWREVSKLVRPFYGDVRTLAGYTRMGAALGIGQGTEVHPVKSWWWRRVPTTPASAVVIGPDYQRIWPDLLVGGMVVDGLAFLDGTDWKRPAPYAIPTGLAQRDPPLHDGRFLFNGPETERGLYAEVWPFEEPLRASQVP